MLICNIIYVYVNNTESPCGCSSHHDNILSLCKHSPSDYTPMNNYAHMWALG